MQPVNVETTHGTGNSDYVGTIMIRLTTDQGETLVYHIPDAVYAPDSSFNILGIPFLGRIPLDIKIRMESDAGTPPALGEGPISDAYSAIAQRVATWIDSPKDTVA